MAALAAVADPGCPRSVAREGREHRWFQQNVAIETIRAQPPPISLRPARPATATAHTAELWFSDVVGRLEQYRSYGENWNGYGEKAITVEAVLYTVSLLVEVAMDGPEPAVVPMSDGGIQVEWYYGETEIEIEVPPIGSELSLYLSSLNRTVEQTSASLKDPIWSSVRSTIAAL